MQSLVEKGGSTFEGLKLLLCENPLPPIDEAIAAAQAEAPRGNYYTEPYSAPLRLLAEQLNVPEPLIHINAGLLHHEPGAVEVGLEHGVPAAGGSRIVIARVTCGTPRRSRFADRRPSFTSSRPHATPEAPRRPTR